MAPAPAARFLGENRWKHGWKHGWKSSKEVHDVFKSMTFDTFNDYIYLYTVNVWDIPKIFLGHYRNTMEYYRCCSVPHPTLTGRRCQESMVWRLVLSGRGGRQLGSACPAKAPGSVREMADLVIFLGRFDAHRSDDHERQKQSKRNTRTSKIYIFLMALKLEIRTWDVDWPQHPSLRFMLLYISYVQYGFNHRKRSQMYELNRVIYYPKQRWKTR